MKNKLMPELISQTLAEGSSRDNVRYCGCEGLKCGQISHTDSRGYPVLGPITLVTDAAEYQNKLFGKGYRVHTHSGNADGSRHCTVCGKKVEVSKSKAIAQIEIATAPTKTSPKTSKK